MWNRSFWNAFRTTQLSVKLIWCLQTLPLNKLFQNIFLSFGYTLRSICMSVVCITENIIHWQGKSTPASTEWHYMCFGLSLLNSISHHFLQYRFTASRSCCVLNRLSDGIDEVLSLYPSANIVVFGDCNAHHHSLRIHCNITDLPGIQALNSSIMQCLIDFQTGFPQ